MISRIYFIHQLEKHLSVFRTSNGTSSKSQESVRRALTLMACQHQRPGLIFCKAGQDQPSTGITCLTGACGFTVKLIIHFKGGGGGGGEGGEKYKHKSTATTATKKSYTRYICGGVDLWQRGSKGRKKKGITRQIVLTHRTFMIRYRRWVALFSNNPSCVD